MSVMVMGLSTGKAFTCRVLRRKIAPRSGETNRTPAVCVSVNASHFGAVDAGQLCRSGGGPGPGMWRVTSTVPFRECIGTSFAPVVCACCFVITAGRLKCLEQCSCGVRVATVFWLRVQRHVKAEPTPAGHRMDLSQEGSNGRSAGEGLCVDEVVGVG